MTITPESPNTLSETIFPGDSEMAALIRSHDWSNTPSGSVENWSPSLRAIVSTMLATRFAQNLFWGEDYIQLYNDAMIPIYGVKHPKALGHSFRETWSEVWDDQMKSLFEGVRATGEPFFMTDQLFPLQRFGYLEETYFTFCYSPIRDETGTIKGILGTTTETTQQTIGQRRLTTLRELATVGSRAKTLQSACRTIADALNPYDIPFALFYQVNEQGNWAERVAERGLSADSAAAPSKIDLTDRSASWSLADVLQHREPLLITDVVDRFGSLPVEPWGESPRSAFVLPILSGNKEQVECLLVAGISPRLEFNAEYRSFLELVAQQVESSIATARSYEQEHQRTEALAELDRAKTTFFSNVSHEFRTPLTLMLGPAEDALSDQADPLSPNQQQRIEVMQRNGLRLLKLVNTLLDFSRIESDHVSAVYEPTDLAIFTTELASVFRSAIERAGMRLIVDCPPLPEPVYVDREMWEKIVLNLLSNAFKFTLTGEISVRLNRVEHQVGLAIQDTGVGIPAVEIPHLFERFHQVKGVQGRTIEGSGIGLSLVQELVKRHGGTVQVRSVEGEGSCFTVSIPTGYAHLPAEQVGALRTQTSTARGASPYVQEALRWLPEESSELQASNAEPLGQRSNLQASNSTVQARSFNHPSQTSELQAQRSNFQAPSSNHPSQSSNHPSQSSNHPSQSSNLQSSRSNPQAPGVKAARVLLVDDNADMRDYLKRLLSQRWQVETAANGAIALDIIQQHPPDLVLSDVMMPALDGFGLLKALRADPLTQSIPIILLSAQAGEEATIEGLEMGADDYLVKPFSARELVARVETHLQLAQLRQERSANGFKNEFLLTVTHELQAPLAAILGWTRLLQTRSFDATRMAQALATIERNAAIEAKLIKDLLDVSSILSGKLHLKTQLVDLVSLLQSVVTEFLPKATAKNIQLGEAISDSLKDTVLADGDRLKQVIANLLDNAIKFTPAGGRVEIQLTTGTLTTGIKSLQSPESPIDDLPSKHEEELQDDHSSQTWAPRRAKFVQIIVSDTGIGIEADFLPYVFDRFTQAEVPSRHTPGGVGIGLAIARHLVELHGGAIEAESEGEGRGATFTVRLPLSQ